MWHQNRRIWLNQFLNFFLSECLHLQPHDIVVFRHHNLLTQCLPDCLIPDLPPPLEYHNRNISFLSHIIQIIAHQSLAYPLMILRPASICCYVSCLSANTASPGNFTEALDFRAIAPKSCIRIPSLAPVCQRAGTSRTYCIH